MYIPCFFLACALTLSNAPIIKVSIIPSAVNVHHLNCKRTDLFIPRGPQLYSVRISPSRHPLLLPEALPAFIARQPFGIFKQ
ncbi:hypothetical protein CIPAW_09G019000 [Carya illinoinensis]|uniref:Secreted protein n=1 Tax=Carya illinoinensis TaxID=32201 RepID=A0A8T1PG38_CARIL|nr:hypothetical protein CIPAW_09G019000 [Carya illinoinensis]